MALDRFRIQMAELLLPSDTRRVLEATKRAAQEVLFREGFGGSYGESPVLPDAHANPSLYRLSEAVNAATAAFANRISSTELRLYQEESNGEQMEVKSHPALTILENPNPFLSRSSLFSLLASDLLLNGNGWWFLAGPERGAPTEIWRCDPRSTRVIRDKTAYIGGYITLIDGEPIPLQTGEVIHFARANPYDPFYGMSALMAAANAAQTGVEMDKWNRTFFARDYGVPAGIVAFDEWITDSVFAANKEEWLRAHGGGQRRTAFTRGGKLQFHSVGLNQTDLDFLAGSKWQQEKIYRVFGTYHLLPAETSDDRKLNERLFLEEHAWPMLMLIAEIITDQLLTFWGPKIGRGRLVVRFEDIRPRERALDLEESREESKGLTLNEWRKRRALDPLPGGDDVMFVHVQGGEKVRFELDAMPTPEPPAPAAPAPASTPEEEPSEAENPDDLQERAELRESANEDTGDEREERFNKSAIHKELDQWQRFVIKRWGDDRRAFMTEQIPGFLSQVIRDNLKTAGDVEGVKTVFATAHDLVEGRIGKASFGVPEGTVVLYLNDVEQILTLQQGIQRAVPSDAPIRWTPREQLHITALHSPLVDEQPFREAFFETSYPGFMVTTERITVFDNGGDALPLVLLVMPSEELRAWQAELYQSFVLRGVPTSPYSDPVAWQPHITLGYIQASYLETSGLTEGGAVELTCYADAVAFTRGEYENIYTRLAAPPDPITDKEELYWYEPGKAIQATRLDFESDFEDLLGAARAGDLDRRQWSARVRTVLRRYGTKAYIDGLIDGGIEDASAESLDDTDQAELNRHLAEQGQYVTALGEVLFKKDGITDPQAELKPAMWFNKSVMPAYEAGRLSADKNGLYEWVLGNTEEHCETCLAATGQIHRLRDWHKSGVLPQADILECGGWECDCKLQRKEKGRARGRLSAIPRH